VLTTLASYRVISKDLPRALSNTAAAPQVKRDSEYYLANIENVKSIDDFLANDRLFKYAAKAFGLGDMAYAKAFLRKVLTEGISKSDSFANTLSDPRYREFAEAFNFAQFGDTTTLFDVTKQGTVDRYVRQTLEENAGKDNDGVRLALYFQRKAPDITSPLELLADPALLKVAQTALGISASSSAMPLDRQVELIADRLDVEDLQDPAKLQSFLNRFASLWELSNPSASAPSPAILFSQPRELGVGASLLTSLQNLKLGGH
jgi:hypothetical protein